MIKSVIVTNYLGESIKLILGEPEKSGFLIKSITGLGPGKADINTTKLSAIDGSVFNSAKVNERNIVLTIVFLEKDTIEDARQLTYKYFPIKKPLTLLIETDNRYCYAEGYVENNDPNIFSIQEQTQISVICPDPYFYSAGETGKNVTIFSGIEPEFEFPFSNESLTENLIITGAIQNKTEEVITYNGDSETGVFIRIHAIGAVKMITIYNTGTRELMKIDTDKLASLTGNGIIASDDILISTVKGNKYVHLVRAGKEYNILNCLGKNSNWFTLAKGDNVFAYVAEEGSSNLQFRIENRVLYEGI